MKNILLILLSILSIGELHSQAKSIYQSGLSAEENLKAIGNLAPYAIGGIGWDNRYEGIKGSPRLLDTLLPSYLLIKGQKNYIELPADIDIVQNNLLFIHPKTGQLLSFPADMVIELIIVKDGKELVFRTTGAKDFGKEMQKQTFYQVLHPGPNEFIKIPYKVFIEADYRKIYSADRRYDEYITNFRYYIIGNDAVFHPVQLTVKSLSKLFPDKRELIRSSFREKKYSDNEQIVIAFLEKIR